MQCDLDIISAKSDFVVEVVPAFCFVGDFMLPL